MKDLIQNLTTYTGMNDGRKPNYNSNLVVHNSIAVQSEVDRLVLLATCFANVSRILRSQLMAEQIADSGAGTGAVGAVGLADDDYSNLDMALNVGTSLDSVEEEMVAPANADVTAVVAAVPTASVLPQQPLTNRRRGSRKVQKQEPAVSYDKLASYKPPLNVLDYSAFEDLDVDSRLFRSLVSLNDQQIYYDEHKHLKVKAAAMQEENATSFASILFDDPTSTAAAALDKELTPPLIDSELLINGTIAVDFTQGYPVVNDSIMWERWDSEPTQAYRWFRQYLKMTEQFGYRNFGEFIRSLSSDDAEIPVVGNSRIGSNRTKTTSAGGGAGDEIRTAENDILLDAFASPQMPVTNDTGVTALDPLTITKIRCYYHLFYWEDRCLCFDTWEASALKERRARRSQWLLDDQYTAFEEVFKEVHTRVMDSVGCMDPKDAMKALIEVAKVLRTTVGLPADKPDEGAAARGAAGGLGGSTNVQVINNTTAASDMPGTAAGGGMVVNFIKAPAATEALDADNNDNNDNNDNFGVTETSFSSRKHRDREHVEPGVLGQL